jgi:hypothetical protein
LALAGLVAILPALSLVPSKPDLRVGSVRYEGGERNIRLRFENRSASDAHFFWSRNDWWINDPALARIASTDGLMRSVIVGSNQVREVSLKVPFTNPVSTNLNVMYYSHPNRARLGFERLVRHLTKRDMTAQRLVKLSLEIPPFIPEVDQFVGLSRPRIQPPLK